MFLLIGLLQEQVSFRRIIFFLKDADEDTRLVVDDGTFLLGS